jgi:hypothetical protein
MHKAGLLQQEHPDLLTLWEVPRDSTKGRQQGAYRSHWRGYGEVTLC